MFSFKLTSIQIEMKSKSSQKLSVSFELTPIRLFLPCRFLSTYSPTVKMIWNTIHIKFAIFREKRQLHSVSDFPARAYSSIAFMCVCVFVWKRATAHNRRRLWWWWWWWNGWCGECVVCKSDFYQKIRYVPNSSR